MGGDRACGIVTRSQTKQECALPKHNLQRALNDAMPAAGRLVQLLLEYKEFPGRCLDCGVCDTDTVQVSVSLFPFHRLKAA